MAGPMRSRGPSSYRFPTTRPYSKNKAKSYSGKKYTRPSARRSVAMQVRRAVMGLSDTKEINAISDYRDLKHNEVRNTAITGDGYNRDGTKQTAVLGQDTRNLTYSLQGNSNEKRDGNSVYAMDLDTNIHFSLPHEAASDASLPDNGLVRIIFYEADHNTFKNAGNNVEKQLMSPVGLVSDQNVICSFLNRKDFRILSDEVVDIRHTGSGGIDRPTQYVYAKKIPLRKNLTYVDTYTPTKQMGVLVLGHAAGLAGGAKFGAYRIQWKFCFKDM